MNTFYITKVNDFYQLRLSSNHFCLSSGTDLSVRLDVARSYLKKYKSGDGVLKALQRLEYGCSVPPTEVAIQKDLIQKGLTYCDEELRELEKECAEFNENNTPLKRTKRLLGKVVQKTLPQKRPEEVEVKISKPKLFRPIPRGV